MTNGRWRIGFVEVPEKLPVLWRRGMSGEAPGPSPGESAVSALMSAFGLLSRVGGGETPWRTFYGHDPIAFLLDAMGDAVTLWRQTGEIVYRNRTAEQLKRGWDHAVAHEIFTSNGGQFERRCLRVRHGDADYVLEIVHEGQKKDERIESPGGKARKRGRRKATSRG